MNTRMLSFDDANKMFSVTDDGLYYRASGKAVRARSSNGYIVAYVGRKSYLAHRVAWLLRTGQCPQGIIDHINGDRTDNSVGNLRQVSPSVNVHNNHTPRRSKTGVRGVVPNRNKYQSRIMVDGKLHLLGSFSTVAEAADVYMKAKARLVKEVCNEQHL